MPSVNFTDKWLKNVKAIDGKQTVYKDKGQKCLILCVGVGGTRTFRAMDYSGGKNRSIKLGVYPALSLAQARAEAASFRVDREEFRKSKVREKPKESPTFKAIAEEFFQRHVDAKGLRSAGEIKRAIENYVYYEPYKSRRKAERAREKRKPRWRDLPFAGIRRRDVNALLDQIVDENGARQADLILAYLSKLMNWYATRDDDYTSPIVRGMRRSSPAASARERILSDDEIRSLWKACAGDFGDIVKLLLLTAQRREKVITMKWVDLDNGIWTIASEKRQKAHAGLLILPTTAREIIEKRPVVAGNEYVFPGRHDRSHFNSVSQGKRDIDKGMPADTPPWTLHDLRRTARSLMSRAGVNSDIAERVLGHAIPGVKGVYDRHEYKQEKARALDMLARLIKSILDPKSGDNVVPMQQGTR